MSQPRFRRCLTLLSAMLCCAVLAPAVVLSVMAYVLAEVPLPVAIKNYVYGKKMHSRLLPLSGVPVPVSAAVHQRPRGFARRRRPHMRGVTDQFARISGTCLLSVCFLVTFLHAPSLPQQLCAEFKLRPLHRKQQHSGTTWCAC
jgi:hypothetical protein